MAGADSLRMEPVEITAGRLHLRPWQDGDEGVLLAACADPQIARWTSVPVPYTEHDAREAVGQWRPAGWTSGKNLTWAVCDSTTGTVLADVALRPARGDGVWDVGCWTAPWARGQGVAPGAVGSVCRWAFAVLEAQRIEWRAQVGNWASLRAAQKAGFQLEGVLRAGLLHRGALVDGWLAALLPGDPQQDTARLPSYADRTDRAAAERRRPGSC